MKLAIIAFAAVAIAAPAVAQDMTPTQYVATAGASDLYEKQSSQLVLGSTKNPKVREFAQMMVRDHAKSTADVKAAAAKSRVRPAPPKLSADQATMLKELRADSGTARDTAYITQQKTAHDQALMVHQNYAANGTAPALKTAAGKIAPVVQHHIDMLNAM